MNVDLMHVSPAERGKRLQKEKPYKISITLSVPTMLMNGL